MPPRLRSTSAKVGNEVPISSAGMTVSASATFFRPLEKLEIVSNGGMLMLMPLCGGIPPEIAWPYVEHVANVVLPRAQQG